MITRQEYPKTTLIFRNVPTKLICMVCETLETQKYKMAVEITLNSENAEQLPQFIKDYPNLLIGAGTVITPDDAKKAINAGCQFILSPILLPKSVFKICKDNKILVVSGAYSPTEIWQACNFGSAIVKVFPARDLPEKYIMDIKAPLGDIPLMAVGGVTLENAKHFLQTGFTHIGMGTGLFGKHFEYVTQETVHEKLNQLCELTLS